MGGSGGRSPAPRQGQTRREAGAQSRGSAGASGLPGCRREKVMRKFLGQVREFLTREDGPTAVEYAVMLALIIVVCIAAITTLGQNANKTFTSVGTAIGTTSS